MASLEKKVDSKLKKWAARVASISVIVGAVTGLYAFISGRLTDVIAIQLNEIRQEIAANDVKQNQQITRLELLNLIYNQPENKAAIEKVAKYYFQELDGDWYVTGIYSEWCEKYGGDTTITVRSE